MATSGIIKSCNGPFLGFSFHDLIILINDILIDSVIIILREMYEQLNIGEKVTLTAVEFDM
jgi:hypothetical protein